MLPLLGPNNVADEPKYPAGALRPHEGNFKPPGQARQAAGNFGPVIKGDGNMTYLCGDCETTLLETVEYKLVRDLVVKCKKCGCTNDIPPSHHGHHRA